MLSRDIEKAEASRLQKGIATRRSANPLARPPAARPQFGPMIVWLILIEMGKGSEDRAIARAITAGKVAGGLLFLALNGYLIYRLSTAYADGQDRGEVLQREKEARRKEGKEKTRAPVVPEEVRPEYVERQVRKYKQVVAAEKKAVAAEKKAVAAEKKVVAAEKKAEQPS